MFNKPFDQGYKVCTNILLSLELEVKPDFI